jgi:hypothetical protein
VEYLDIIEEMGQPTMPEARTKLEEDAECLSLTWTRLGSRDWHELIHGG